MSQDQSSADSHRIARNGAVEVLGLICGIAFLAASWWLWWAITPC